MLSLDFTRKTGIILEGGAVWTAASIVCRCGLVAELAHKAGARQARTLQDRWGSLPCPLISAA